MRAFRCIRLFQVVVFLLTCFTVATRADAAPTIYANEHFLLDHNRVFVELTFVLPDGAQRKTLAFVDSGDPGFTFTTALAEELGVSKASDLHVLFGGRPLNVSAVRNFGAFDYFYPGMYLFPGLHVEANLPATVLEQYDVVLDYGKRTLTLAAPGSLKHEGVRVPCSVNRTTAVASVQGQIAGASYAFAIDNGSAYTWVDRGVTESWTGAHSQWLRGIGAVGDSNMNGSYAELTGMIVRIPDIDLHGLSLRQVGALGVGPGFDKTVPNFFVWYSGRTPGPVIGFLGGNALRSYRLEIDYADSATYWKRERAPDPHDLDQVGIMIRPTPDGQYFIMGVTAQNGKETVDGIEAGDQLISVDGIAVTEATMGRVLAALHGKPGVARVLVIERSGKQLIANARVTSF